MHKVTPYLYHQIFPGPLHYPQQLTPNYLLINSYGFSAQLLPLVLMYLRHFCSSVTSLQPICLSHPHPTNLALSGLCNGIQDLLLLDVVHTLNLFLYIAQMSESLLCFFVLLLVYFVQQGTLNSNPSCTYTIVHWIHQHIFFINLSVIGYLDYFQNLATVQELQ